MYMQRQPHTAIHENNFDLHLDECKAFLSSCFYFNLRNYIHYGRYYIETLNRSIMSILY